LAVAFRLLAHAVVERALDAAIGDPGLDRAVDRQHEHDEADQGDDVFGEQALRAGTLLCP
jgi:hypothetical protein